MQAILSPPLKKDRRQWVLEITALVFIVIALVRLLTVLAEALIHPIVAALVPITAAEFSLGGGFIVLRVGAVVEALLEFALWLAVGLAALRLARRRDAALGEVPRERGPR